MKRSRTKIFIKNVYTSIIYQIIVLISGFIVPTLMLHAYGSEINGLSASISQFIAYFTLVEAGLSGASVYALYKPLANNDFKRINIIVSTTNAFYIKSGLIFLSLSVCMAIIYPMFISTKELSHVEVSILVLILATSGLIDFFTLSKYRALLTADQKQYIVSIGSSAYILIYTLIIILLAKEGSNIIIVRGIALVSVILRSVILKVYCKIHYKFIDFKVQQEKNVLNKRWDALYLQILGSIHSGAPAIIASILTTLKEVSVYSIYNMVVGGIGGVISVFSSGLAANFGNVIANAENETLKIIYDQFECIYYMAITMLYSITVVLIVPFIKLYTNGITDVNYVRPITAILICLNGILFSMKSPQGMMVIAAGMYKETRVQTTIQGLIAVLGGLVGAFFCGLDGVLLGAILSNCYRTVDLIYFSPHYIVHIKPTKSILRVLRSLSIFLCAVLLSIVVSLNPRNYLEWIMNSIVISSIIIIITFTVNIILDTQSCTSFYNRVISIKKNK